MCALAYIKKKLYLCSRFNGVRIVMKKLLGIWMIICLATCAWAETVFTFSEASDMSQTKDGISLSIAKGNGQNEPKATTDYETSQFEMRLYIGNTITVSGTELTDAAAFTAFMADKTVAAADREELEADPCTDLFFNGQGICLGAGEIWLNDMSYMTENAPDLRVIAINGIE